MLRAKTVRAATFAALALLTLPFATSGDVRWLAPLMAAMVVAALALTQVQRRASLVSVHVDGTTVEPRHGRATVSDDARVMALVTIARSDPGVLRRATQLLGATGRDPRSEPRRLLERAEVLTRTTNRVVDR